MTSTTDPRQTIANSPLSRFQILIIALCTFLVALDGFDVLAISFSAPGIAKDWGVSRGALGIVLSMELIGMAFGSIFLGNMADRFGRRPTILFCLIIMASGMYLASIATGVNTLSAYRFYTGLGIGGMLSAANAMGAEYSNLKRRALAVVIISTGYPLGAIIGGSVVSQLLVTHSWRSVFEFGAIVTALFWPVAYFCIPESVEFQYEKRPKSALKNINKTLLRMGHDAIEHLPNLSAKANKAKAKSSTPFRDLFSNKFAAITTLLTIAYFAHIMTFYFILKWTPKIVVDMGYAPSLAGSVLVWANIGGALGCVLIGLLSLRYKIQPLVIIACFIASILVVIFGRGYTALTQLSMITAAAGFFINSAIVGLYAIFTNIYPTHLRATGIGFIIGIGRGGSALGPILAGFLFANGHGLQMVAIFMGCGSLVAGIALLVLRSVLIKRAAV